MLSVVMLALQIVGSSEQSAALPSFTAVPACKSGDPSGADVVVCGHRDVGRYRLPPPSDRYARDKPVPPAALDIGNAKVAATTQQVMIGGVPSNRLMVSVKLPF